MAVAFVLEIPHATVEQLDRVLATLRLDGQPAPGQILHLAGPRDGGVVVVDVWETRDAFEAFAWDKLVRAALAAGLVVAPPRLFPVHELLVHGIEEPTGIR